MDIGRVEKLPLKLTISMEITLIMKSKISDTYALIVTL